MKSLSTIWESEQKTSLRRGLKRFYESEFMALILLISILFSLVITVIETDAQAAADADSSITVPEWVIISKYAMVVFYSVELMGRLFVDRKRFFVRTLNLLDLTVLTGDIVGMALGSTTASIFLALRAGRLLRISKSVRVMMYTPELAHMVRGLVGAVKALFWGLALVIFILCLWSVLAVRLIHPLNMELTRSGVWDRAGCERCPRAFDSVLQAMLSFTQSIVAGDSWGMLVVPIVEHYPETIIFFTLVLLSVQLAIINLILAIILDKANESRQQTEKELLQVKESEQGKAKLDFIKICQSMDEDESGYLSFKEIEDGFEEQEAFSTILRLMDIDREDLFLVFRMLDQDNSGSVAYEEFAEQLFKMRTRDLHTMTLFTQFYVSDLHRMIRDIANGLNVGTKSFNKSGTRKLAPKGNSSTTVSTAATASAYPARAATPLALGAASGVALGEAEKPSAAPETAPGYAGPALAEATPVKLEQSACCGGVPRLLETSCVPTRHQGNAAGVGPEKVASAWSTRLDEAPLLPKGADVLALVSPLSQDLGLLRKDLQGSLRGISDRLETNARMIESLTAVLLGDPLKLASLGNRAASDLKGQCALNGMLPSPKARRASPPPTTPFCCQGPAREQPAVL